jgi:hypothetical protein
MHNAFASKLELFQPCEYPACSFFDLIDSIWKEPKGTSSPLHRFCTLMRKMNAKSFLQEKLILNQELSEEKEMVEKYFDGEVELEATRLTFFCSPPDCLKWDAPKKTFEKYILGYAVIVTLKFQKKYHGSHLIEAIVRPPSIVLLEKDKDPFIEPVTNYYVHNVKKFLTTIGTGESPKALSIEGSFFCQQNNLTSVCAHAALRMAINSSPLLDVPKLTNKYVNDCLGIQDYNPKGGLSTEQIEAVVSKLGYKCHSANFSENTQIEYDQFIYPSLESCFPVILGIQGYHPQERKYIAHVVSVLGHTINSDRWSSEAKCGYGNYPIQRYIPSVSWCDHFIISDDNYGMFVTLPSDMIRNFIVPTKNPNLHVSRAISILPNEVVLRGYEAEQMAIVIAQILINNVTFTPKNKWHERLKKNKNGKHKDLVLRTLLQKKEQYLDFIHDNANNMTTNQQQCFDNLPNYVWVTEVSLPNIYTGNKHKLGDVVIRANASQKELIEGKSLALAWFPGFIQLGFTPKVEAWGIDTHVPLIRNTKDSFLEW